MTPEEQKVEMQRAFYAGAAAVLETLFGVSRKGMPEDAGELIIYGLCQEISGFFNGLRNDPESGATA